MRIQKFRLEMVKESSSNYDFDKSKVSNPGDVRDLLEGIFSLSKQAEEIFVIVCFDTKNKVVGAFEVSRGALDVSIVHPREVFKRALLCNAASIICAHNHPSGSVTPSREDNEITDRLAESGTILGVRLLDHIIVGDNEYYSFKEANRI